MNKKRISFISLLGLLCICITLFITNIFSIKKTVAFAENTRDIATYLADMNYETNAIVFQNKNAVNGGNIAIGQRNFSCGISFYGLGNNAVAYVEIDITLQDFDVFDMQYGIDRSLNDGIHSAEIVVKVDGETKLHTNVFTSEFQEQFNCSVEGKKKLRIEVYSKKDTCVSFGDPAFYMSSSNAATCEIVNVTLGEWPAPVTRNYNLYGDTLKIGNTTYNYGYCVNSISSFDIKIPAKYKFFSAYCGIDEGVIGGQEAGSVQLSFSSFDEKGTLVSKVTTPVLYGYNEEYLINLYIESATIIRINVMDGNDNIANDMTAIGNPIFSNSLLEGHIYMSDMPLDGQVGYGEIGIDKSVTGEKLNYQIQSKQLSYKKGVGLHLMNVPYRTYINDKSNTNNFSYVKTNIEGMNFDFFETYIYDINSHGAWYEIWIDGKCQYKSDTAFKSFNREISQYPKRISAKIPKNSKMFEVRLIADTIYDYGRIELVNAAFYKQNSSLINGYIIDESTSNYSIYRQTLFDGNYVQLKNDNKERYVYDSLSTSGECSYSFDVSELPYDTFTSVVASSTEKASTNASLFADVTYSNGITKHFEANLISNTTFSFYYGNNAKSIKFSTHSSEKDISISLINPNLSKKTLKDVEYISEMKWSEYATGWGNIGINKNLNGDDLNINGKMYENGISMHAFPDENKEAFVKINLPLGSEYKVFESVIGVNKDTENNSKTGSVVFLVYGDNKLLYKSGLKRVTDDGEHITVNIRGISELKLAVTNGDGSYYGDWADWINACITKDVSLLEDYLDITNPVDKQSIVLSKDKIITLTGNLLGINEIAEVYLNNKLVSTCVRDEIGKVSSDIVINKLGLNTIKLVVGDIKKEVEINVAGEVVDQSKTIITKSSTITISPNTNGIVISSILDNEGHELVAKNGSFINFPTRVKYGGKGSEWTNINWNYVDVKSTSKKLLQKNINSAHENYEGDEIIHTFTYESDDKKLVLTSVWSAEANFESPIRHKITLKNNSGEKLFVETADSMNLEISKNTGEYLTNSYSYKGAVATTSYGYRCDNVDNGYIMDVFSTTEYNNGWQTDQGYIPWISLNKTINNQNFGLYLGIMWSDCRIKVYGKENSVYVQAGLDDDFITEIPSGSDYYIPEVFIGTYIGDVDDGSNDMKKWYFAFKMPESNRVDNRLPSTGYNFWEILDSERRSWRMSDAKYYDAVWELAKAGTQEVTLDTYWWKTVGDWRGVHEKWNSTISYSSNFAHALGLYFNMYMQAGNESSDHTDALTASGVHGNPNWFAKYQDGSWDELCLADPDAFEYLKHYLANYYMEFGMDTMRTDFGYILGVCLKNGHEHIQERDDVGYWTSLRTYQLFDYMKELFPMPEDVNDGSELNYFKWENCNCGGTLKDFMSMSYATRIQTTDAYSTGEVRRSFYDTSYCFPSMQLMLWLNDYMYDPVGPVEGDQYRFFSLLLGSGVPMMSMLSDMTDSMKEAYAQTLYIYKNWMQELVKYGNVYHNMPRCDDENWDGMEYYDDYTGKGAVLAFKPNPKGTVSDTYKIPFKGLNDESDYYVWSENGYIEFKKYSGKQLRDGINITMEGKYKAEVIYFIRTDAADVDKLISSPANPEFNINVEDGVELKILDEKMADYYVVEISKDNSIVFNYIVRSLSGVSKVNGFSSGKYSLKVTAVNRFGKSSSEKEFIIESSIDSSSNFASDIIAKDDVVIDDVHYLKGYELDLSSLPSGQSKKFNLINIGNRKKINLNAGIDITDGVEEVKVSVYAETEYQYQKIKEYTLNINTSTINDELTLPSGTLSIMIEAINTTPQVIIQKYVGYGRTLMKGNILSNNYEFSSDVKVIRNGLNEDFPRAGIMGAYVSQDKFSALYVEPYYNRISVYTRSNGIATDVTQRFNLDGFDYKANHNLKAIRKGNIISYYIDEIFITSVVFEEKSSFGVVTEDAQARFANLVCKQDEKIINVSYETDAYYFNINGQIFRPTSDTRKTLAQFESIPLKIKIVV